jgi:hypothetical protein
MLVGKLKNEAYTDWKNEVKIESINNMLAENDDSNFGVR